VALEELVELVRVELVVVVLDDALVRLEVVVAVVPELADAFVELVLLPEVWLDDAAPLDVELPLDSGDDVATEEVPVDPDEVAVLARDPDGGAPDVTELLSPNPPAPGSTDVPQPGIARSTAQTRPRPLRLTRMLIASILHRSERTGAFGYPLTDGRSWQRRFGSCSLRSGPAAMARGPPRPTAALSTPKFQALQMFTAQGRPRSVPGRLLEPERSTPVDRSSRFQRRVTP
jgi:hypothetical protein